ncbi:MAG: indole-3-glycerol phosphate synthase TrpC [Candidatus Omnitrophota bacterium]
MILSEIIEAKRKCIEAAKCKTSLDYIRHKLAISHIKRRDFKKAVSVPFHINIIAEIKQASPSRGVIRKDFNPAKIAVAYQINGASAISVLTEEDYFKGRLDYIPVIKKVSSLPVLRKDFIIDEYQIYESALAGADAILLIASILSKEELHKFCRLAKKLHMDVLCEVHAEEDIEKALFSHADIIGINNRDLGTFKVSINTTQNLLNLIPENKVIVSESGIKNNSDLLFLKSLGVNAALIGEALMEADDIGNKLREMLGQV